MLSIISAQDHGLKLLVVIIRPIPMHPIEGPSHHDHLLLTPNLATLPKLRGGIILTLPQGLGATDARLLIMLKGHPKGKPLRRHITTRHLIQIGIGRWVLLHIPLHPERIGLALAETEAGALALAEARACVVGGAGGQVLAVGETGGFGD